MRSIFLLSSLCVLILCFSACKSTQYTPDTFEGQRLYFGSGGGFTGMVQEYCLLENGQLFYREKMKGEGEFVEKGKVKKSATKEIFAKATELGLAEQSFSHPGNLYYFLSVGSNEDGNQMTWGAEDYDLPPEIQAFFESCQATVPQ